MHDGRPSATRSSLMTAPTEFGPGLRPSSDSADPGASIDEAKGAEGACR